LPDESFSSWFYRLSYANGLMPAELYRIASERVNDFATVVSSSLSSSAFTLRSSFLAD
jgi:hypothetical protein